MREAALEQYCDAVSAADPRGEELFADIDESDDARLAAEREIVEFVRSSFPARDELPEEIWDDFATFLAGMERNTQAGIDPSEEQEAAEERLRAWEEEHC